MSGGLEFLALPTWPSLAALALGAAALFSGRLPASAPLRGRLLATLALAATLLACARAAQPGLGALAAAVVALLAAGAARPSSPRPLPPQLLLPWVLVGALDPGPFVALTGLLSWAPAIATAGAVAACAAVWPALTAAPGALRLAGALALALAPAVSPLWAQAAAVEVPTPAGTAVIAAPGVGPLVLAKPGLDLLWEAGRWLGAAAVAAAHARRLSATAGLAGLAFVAAAAATAWALQVSAPGSSALVSADGPIALAGAFALDVSPAALRVAMLITALMLAMGAPSTVAALPPSRAIVLAAVAASALALATLPWLVGPGWLLDSASLALFGVLASLSLAAREDADRPATSVARLVLVASAALLMGGPAGWRVASAWMP